MAPMSVCVVHRKLSYLSECLGKMTSITWGELGGVMRMSIEHRLSIAPLNQEPEFPP